MFYIVYLLACENVVRHITPPEQTVPDLLDYR